MGEINNNNNNNVPFSEQARIFLPNCSSASLSNDSAIALACSGGGEGDNNGSSSGGRNEDDAAGAACVADTNPMPAFLLCSIPERAMRMQLNPSVNVPSLMWCQHWRSS